jgi:hypothetical protein
MQYMQDITRTRVDVLRITSNFYDTWPDWKPAIGKTGKAKDPRTVLKSRINYVSKKWKQANT